MPTPGKRSRQVRGPGSSVCWIQRDNADMEGTGCLTCRTRHRKCDEERPICKMCQKTGRKCEYGSGIRWSSTNVSSRVHSGGVEKITSIEKQSKRKGMSAKGLTSPTSQDRQRTPAFNVFSVEEINRGNTNTQFLDTGPAQIQRTTWEDPGPSAHNRLPFDGADFIWNELFSDQQFLDPIDSTFGMDHEIASRDDDMPLIQWQDEDLPETFPSVDASSTGILFHKTKTQHVRPIVSPQLGPWLSATLGSSSEELAFNHYLNDASTRIPAFDGPKNPYRKLCLVSISYPLLLHTILYVSTVSMYNHGEADGETVTSRRTQALLLLQNAAKLLETQRENGSHKWIDQHQSLSVLSLREVTLAAYLMYIVIEVMMGSQKTEAHLEAAFSLMLELDYVDHLPQGFYSRFLVQRFAMIDVVLSFLRRRRPLAPQNFVLYHTVDEMDEQESSFRELTGCPQAVLSFLARISNLASSNDAAQTAEAYQLESEMRLWGSLRYPGPYSDPDLVGILQDEEPTAENTRNKQLDILSECFYWVAHLLLARRVFLDPTDSPRVQLYRKHLFLLMDRLPAGCGPDSSLPFPFYIAAREAINSHDRDWVRQKHTEMLHKYPDQSRELMMRLTEEIWSKHDGYGETTIQDPMCVWVSDDIYIGVLDSQASHFLF
ncbi:unnamed protein product [Fusarium venenatum]|uniref:Zn(2)-C6 fungal-type domain-containing protein n=1 Tax=Fusarium venenatum TaxID=56646 RepID=A0A2L2TTY0_9HYPO|nr:LOW QUALITY PROTEIN: uncharacterized protein FVRRES_04048 [Fusarium venenatum]CEI67536.1 unnamed protein product [Fusarium venenatum]